jgi:hypothetical protein
MLNILNEASKYEIRVQDAHKYSKYQLYWGYYYSFMEEPIKAKYCHEQAWDYYKKTNNQNVLTAIIMNNCLAGVYLMNEKMVRGSIDSFENCHFESPYSLFFLNRMYSCYYDIIYEKNKNPEIVDSIRIFNERALDILYQNEGLAAILGNDQIVTALTSALRAGLISGKYIDTQTVWQSIEKAENMVGKSDFFLMADIQHLKGTCYYMNKNYNRAEAEALKGLICKEQEGTDGQRQYLKGYFDLYNLLSEIYQAKKDMVRALKYEKLKNETYITMQNEFQLSMEKALEYEKEIHTKDQNIRILRENKSLYERISLLSAIIIGLLILILLILVLLYRNTKKILQDKLELNRLHSVEIENEVNRLKLSTLRSKFIPHFTGNVLNSINYLISRAPNSAQKYIAEFNVFLNRTLLNSDRLSCTLKEELDYVGSYLDLEKLRYEDELEYSFEIRPDVELGIQIPTMILQTLSENAIKHGLKRKSGPGAIRIEAQRKGGYTVISVEDNGIGRAAAAINPENSTGKGLKIVEEQLEMYRKTHGKACFFDMTDLYDASGKAVGTRCEVKIETRD